MLAISEVTAVHDDLVDSELTGSGSHRAFRGLPRLKQLVMLDSRVLLFHFSLHASVMSVFEIER